MQSNERKKVFIIITDIVLQSILNHILNKDYQLIFFSNFNSALDAIYNDHPDLIIIDVKNKSISEMELIKDFKKDPAYGKLPIIAIFEDYFRRDFVDELLLDDFILSKNTEFELVLRVSMAISKTERMIDVNPLTFLPGNITISKEIQKRIDNKEIFALAYVDLDNFKPFNDRYGFSRGDEILKMLGRLILNIVKSKNRQNSFVGHIGGDDFIFIIDYDLVEEVGIEIINYFNTIIPTFYDEPERSQGFIRSIDRQGRTNVFPIMKVSIGVAHTLYKTFKHYGEMSSIATEMKKFAKSQGGGCVKIDRRKT